MDRSEPSVPSSEFLPVGRTQGQQSPDAASTLPISLDAGQNQIGGNDATQSQYGFAFYVHYLIGSLFLVYGLPLYRYRLQFRQIVYADALSHPGDTSIAWKPYFVRETLALLGLWSPGRTTPDVIREPLLPQRQAAEGDAAAAGNGDEAGASEEAIEEFKRSRSFYRRYLLVYMALFVAFQSVH